MNNQEDKNRLISKMFDFAMEIAKFKKNPDLAQSTKEAIKKYSKTLRKLSKE